ncbi:class I SAM-dependent methyltransferase [Eoetvoesiella caeni]|uniref:class I SAM-dependent methyltransferase n=1 Tax=Eoetvoesiella caeni TaxID=645616 RepID=UPI0014751D8B|nr:class I SAM-dependent methyltransferase [Eoetvoesiella caeni]
MGGAGLSLSGAVDVSANSERNRHSEKYSATSNVRLVNPSLRTLLLIPKSWLILSINRDSLLLRWGSFYLPSQEPGLNSPDTANQLIAEHYDRTQYTSNAFFYSSPGHLRATAHLYGVETVPIEKARVLELGCAAGGNLLPFALAYPDAHAVGVDLSPLQIQQGQKVVQDLGIKNLDLRAMSLTDIDNDFGEFDYIIVHGVFSWVPPEVRQAILRICRENLSPQGIAYVSYNTYPGWKAGDIVRDAMLLHSHSATSDEEKLSSAKAMLTLLSDGLAASNPLAPSLRAAVAQLQKQSDYYVAHEYLETFNAPCYFLEFADAAQQAGLAYLGDAEAHCELSATYGQNVQLNHSLIALGQPKVLRQQYLDLAVGRNFRKSMLVHQEREADVAVSPNLDLLRDLRWAGHFTKADTPANAPVGSQAFTNHKGGPLHTSEAKVLAVIKVLSDAWPATISFSDLVLQVQASTLVEGNSGTAEQSVQEALEILFKLNQLRFSLEAGPYDDKRHDIPTLIPGFAYMQVASKDAAFGVGCFSFWHDVVNVQLKDAEAFILPYMNGTNSAAQLRTRLCDALRQGKVAGTDGNMLTGQRNLDAKVQEMLDKLMALLKAKGLLLA